MTFAPTPSRRPVSRAGFTLIELMVSLAIVLLLVLGVNKIFGIASQTVGAGQAMSAAQRGSMTGHSVFYEDLNGAVTANPPFFLIRSESTAAFRNAADEQADRDYNRTLSTLIDVDEAIRTADWNADGTEDRVNETTPRTTMDARNHRVDQLCFFARGLFPRQTGNDGTYIADMSASEAMIWYGHLAQPKDPTNPSNANADLFDEFDLLRPPGFRPGTGSSAPETAATNPNNFYATSWILGRQAVLLRERNPVSGLIEVVPGSGIDEIHSFRNNTGDASLQPLELGSPSNASTNVPAPGTGNQAFPIQYARYDLADTSIDQFRSILGNAINVGGRALNWYDPAKSASGGGLGYRFGTFQYPIRPLSSAAAARTTPAFLPNCTQFAVEFAGDFISQNNNGDVIVGSGPDGIIDFVVIGTKTVTGQTVLLTKTRWYGYPRDTGGPNGGPPDGIINGTVAGGFNPDVVPLRDIANNGVVGGPGAPFPFERDVNDNAIGIPQSANYAAANGIPLNGRYLCAWGPDTAAAGLPLPKMLRITMALDDPQGRLASGPTFEYVIQLP